MGIFDELEKLVTEHGSAAVLRERINLVNDKYAELERRAATLEAKCRALETERDEAIARANRLDERLQQRPEQTPDAIELDDESGAIMVLLSNAGDRYPTAAQIADAVQLSPVKAQYLLDKLEKLQFVRHRSRFGAPKEYYLREDGRAYLIEMGLMQ